jgi:hypothetical protein
LPQKDYKSDSTSPLLFQLLNDRCKSEFVKKNLAPVVDDETPKDFKTDTNRESSGLASLKGFPPLNSMNENYSEPEFPLVKDKVNFNYDDSDIIETFDVISDDSGEVAALNPIDGAQDEYSNHELDDFMAESSEMSRDILQDDALSGSKKIDIPNETKKTYEGLSSLKGLPPLKLAPLNRGASPLDPLKKPNLNQINRDILENQLDTDPELQETFNRLQNDSMDAAVVEPFDLTEDISVEEENNPTDDISEIHTTDRSVSPRFVSSVLGHDIVEEVRPKDF